MSIKSLLSPVFKKVSLTNFLLILLVIVVFAGLFKKEIMIWRLVNGPRFREIDKKVQYACQKDSPNPEYLDYQETYWQLKKDCLERVLGPGGKYYPRVSCFLTDDANACRRCEREADKAMPSPPPQTILVPSTCERTEKETWFFAFGKYWFNNESLKVAEIKFRIVDSDKVKEQLTERLERNSVLLILTAIIIAVGWYIGLVPKFISWLYKLVKGRWG